MEELTQHIKSLVAISDSNLAHILGKIEEKHFHKKQHLLQLDEYAKEVYFILSGCTRTYILDYNGIEHNIAFAMENWWFGDLQSFINKKPAIQNIQALEDTTVLAMNQEDWNALVEEVPEFVSYTRALFRNTMFSHENRILQNLSFTAEERYQSFLQNYPNFSQRISQ